MFYLLVFVLLMSGVVIRELILYGQPEEKQPLSNKTSYVIGVLTDYDSNLKNYEAIVDIASNDINSYIEENDLGVNFTFDVKSCDAQTSVALEHVIEWNKQDVHLIVGPPWSSMYCPSRGWVTNNEGIVMSHESTSPTVAADDNGFRLTIMDTKTSQVLAKLLNEREFETIITIERKDSWGEFVSLELERYFDGEVIRVMYAGESTDFKDKLEEMEAEVSGHTGEKTAVVALSFNEISYILNQAMDYEQLSSTPWFATELDVNSNELVGDAGASASKVNLTGYSLAIPESERFNEINELYESETYERLSYFRANVYDACWLYALSVIELGTDNSTHIKPILPEIALEYDALTGAITFDDVGDRNTANYVIFQYAEKNGEYYSKKIQEFQIEFGPVVPSPSVH